MRKQALFSLPAVGSLQKAENDVHCHKNRGRRYQGEYYRMLKVTRQGFYKYLANKDRPWKYQDLADAMWKIALEDECNDTYGGYTGAVKPCVRA